MSDEMKSVAEVAKQENKKQPKKPKKKIFQDVWEGMVIEGCRLWMSQAGDIYLQLKINDG